MKISRNDPCPCGSGKKYKKCCLSAVTTNDLEYRRQRQVEADLTPRLIDYAMTVFGQEALHDAWKIFNGVDEIEAPEPDSPINTVFIPWFIFNCEFEEIDQEPENPLTTTIAEAFWIQHEAELTEAETSFLDAAIGLPYSMCEILEVKPAVGMKVRDLFTMETYEVSERVASEFLKKGQIIYCANIEVNKIRWSLGIAPLPLRPTSKKIIFELRDEITEFLEKQKLTEMDVVQFESEIRTLYIGLLVEMLVPPTLVNTDKEEILPQQVYFDVVSVDDSYHRLKDLPGEENEHRLLERATIEDGQIVAVEIPWGGGNAEAKEHFGNPVLLGVLKLKESRLVAEVNSTERAKTIRKIIEERLGDQATYKSTVIEPMDIPYTDIWEERAYGSYPTGRRTKMAGNKTVGAGTGEDSPSWI